jgi:hypothetical protein
MTETGGVEADELIYLSRDPVNAETPLERQVGVITTTSRHYVRDHFPRPHPSEPLVVDGAVRAPMELSLDDLRSLPSRSLVVTLECAGNGRAFLDPPAPGEQWRIGAVGTAEWTGASLRAGVRPQTSARASPTNARCRSRTRYATTCCSPTR